MFLYILDLEAPDTLQGTNVSHLGKSKIIFKMPFFGDILVPWRVFMSFTSASLLLQPTHVLEWKVEKWHLCYHMFPCKTMGLETRPMNGEGEKRWRKAQRSSKASTVGRCCLEKGGYSKVKPSSKALFRVMYSKPSPKMDVHHRH